MYAIHILGKHQCGPESRVMFKRPGGFTRDTGYIPLAFLIAVTTRCTHNNQADFQIITMSHAVTTEQ